MKILRTSYGRLVMIFGGVGFGGLLIAFPWLLTKMFSTAYLPHGFCFMWNPQLLWLHVMSDGVIGISYVVIAGSLTRLVLMCRRDIPFQSIFIAFGVFILACGCTHLIGILVLWNPLYWLEGDVKLLTAFASVITAIVLPLYLKDIQGLVRRSATSLKNERRFIAATNSSLDSIYILTSIRDSEGEIEDFEYQFVNTNGAKLLDRKPAEIVGRRMCQIFPANRSLGLFYKYKRVVETGVPLTEELSVNDPGFKAAWLKIQAVKLEDGVAVTTSDITDRKRLEFERTKAFTQSLIDSSPATIIVTDLRFKITAINPAAEKMLWYKPDELIGHHTPLILYDHRELQAEATRLSTAYATDVSIEEVIFFVSRAQRVDQEAEWTFIRKGGSRITVQVTVTPLVGDAAEDSGFMITAYDVSERKQREEYISHISQHDALTGLPTRQLLFDRLQVEISRSIRSGKVCSLLLLDLNDFKGVNDSLGHHAGDALLVEVAKRLREAVRASDTVARMGGDEFLVLLGDLQSNEDAAIVADHVKEALDRPFNIANQHAIAVGSSIGICSFPDHAGNANELVKNADVAMYYAKTSGGRQIEFYSEELQRKFLRRQEIMAGLREALHREEFQVVYQPQFDLETLALCGFEALIRWESKRLGKIAPDQFIPLAEESGLMEPIGSWVLRTACRDMQQLNRRFSRNFFVSVNLSPRQVEQRELVVVVADALQTSGLEPSCLELEITEGVLMKDSSRTTTILEGLRALGARIAIDDFGTGFSNMSYLLRLPIDCLKIDRSIINDCSGESNSATVASAIISLAHQLKLAVVAEGAETYEEIEFLKRERCDRVQGFYFCRPVSLEAIESASPSDLADHSFLQRLSATSAHHA